MSKYTKAQLDRVLTNVLTKGMGVKEARVAEGVSHTPAELHAFKFEWFTAELPAPGQGEWFLTPELASYLRFLATDPNGKTGWGIGRIMVATNATEGKVRAAIREGSAISDRGHRTGKGGRYFNDERELYTEGLRATGTHLALEGEAAELAHYQQANRMRFLAMDINELRELAKANSVKVAKNATKAKLAIELAKVI